MKQPSNLPPGVTDRMIENQPSNLPRRGPKTKASKGQNRYKKITFTMPHETYELIMAAKGTGKLSSVITELVNEALMARIGKEL